MLCQLSRQLWSQLGGTKRRKSEGSGGEVQEGNHHRDGAGPYGSYPLLSVDVLSLQLAKQLGSLELIFFDLDAAHRPSGSQDELARNHVCHCLHHRSQPEESLLLRLPHLPLRAATGWGDEPHRQREARRKGNGSIADQEEKLLTI